MALAKSPLAPVGGFPSLPVIKGATFASAAAGVKYQDRDDVMLAVLQPGTAIAGVFTRSATRSAPVLDCQKKIGLDPSAGAAILVNSGNSNAFTGGRGFASVEAITNAVSAETNLSPQRVFTASTGVIGEPLPHERIVATIESLAANADAKNAMAAAKAIMTTDTFPKGSGRTVSCAKGQVNISGFAKGSGMIAPDMATMLVYIFTDAVIDQGALQALLRQINETTFNAITVDSDTSTSDSLMVAATGASGVDVTNDPAFAVALSDVMLDLAHQVVRDGEGASKFITINVTSAADDSDAKRVAMAIANSPLVKTAFAGEDPNWGRIVMAIGKSGATADRDRITIHFGDILVAENGWVSPDYREEDGASYMKRDNLLIDVDLGLGSGQSTMWTCDLTHQYITINADYRS